jgi:elongation factor Ts
MDGMTTMTFTAKDVQELRQRTGAGMMDCKRALEESGGNMEKAAESLRAKGIAKAEKRAGRTASEGQVISYLHHDGKTGVLLELNCETDFVARTEDFKQLGKEIAMHIAARMPLAVTKEQVAPEVVERERRIAEEQVRASGKPESLVPKIVDGKVEAFYKDVVLMSQPWIREDKKTIADLVKETSAKVGENIIVRRFARFRIGEE